MKVVFTLIAVLAVICLGVYFLGGYRSFDPSQQGRDARAALIPGATLTQVLEITGEPRSYRPLIKETERFGGEEVEFVRMGPPNRFTRDGVERRLAENSLPEGFVCLFVYSGSVAFTTAFDGTGTLTDVSDAPTAADLFQYRD